MEKSVEISKSIEYIINHAKNDENILSVILFGSYLKGEQFNDIDICLITYPNCPKELDKILIDYYAKFPILFDFSIFSTLPLYIKNRVQNEGKILLNKNYDSLFTIYLQNIQEYNDFKPHYDTFLEAVKNG